MSDVAQETGRVRPRLLILLAVLGVAAIVGGGFGLSSELTRKPTPGELAAAANDEPSARWRYRPAGQIFPAEIDYTFDGVGQPVQKARRVGIAAPVTCRQAFDGGIAEVLSRNGCVTALRATYLDASGYLVTTIGIAVMPNGGRAAGAVAALSESGQEGVHVVGFPGTVAGSFNDGQRQRLGLERSTGPFLVFHSSGWIDGRAPLAGEGNTKRTESFRFPARLAAALIDELSADRPPCVSGGPRC